MKRDSWKPFSVWKNGVKKIPWAMVVKLNTRQAIKMAAGKEQIVRRGITVIFIRSYSQVTSI